MQKVGGKQKEKREKFVKLAEKRTANAIKAIRVISKLGNPFAYEYDENDIKKISGALIKEIEEMKVRMSKKTDSSDITFKL